jgi:hypothetical protein
MAVLMLLSGYRQWWDAGPHDERFSLWGTFLRFTVYYVLYIQSVLRERERGVVCGPRVLVSVYHVLYIQNAIREGGRGMFPLKRLTASMDGDGQGDYASDVGGTL